MSAALPPSSPSPVDHPTPAQPSAAPLRLLFPRLALALYWPALAAATHWPHPPDPPAELQDLQLDKLVHFAFFTLLTFLLVKSRLAGRSASSTRNLAVAAILAAVYACVDEFTQAFIPNRTVSLLDALANLLAVGSMTVVIALSESRWRGQTALAWVCRAALALFIPYLTLLALGPKIHLETFLIAIAPPLQWHIEADKLAHFLFTTVFFWLIYGAQFLGIGRRLPNALLAFFTLALAGPVLEVAQQTIGRGLISRQDMLSNLAGLGVGVLFLALTWLLLRIAKPRPLNPWQDTLPLPEPGPTPSLPPATAIPPTSAIRPPKTESHGFVRTALVVSSLTFLSRLTGLARDIYLTSAFALSSIADAFWFGFLIPNLFRRLFGEGALTAAFIPLYTKARTQDALAAQRFASLILALTFILLGSLTLLGELALAGVISTQDLSADWTLALQLTMIMLPYMPMVCLVALMGAILQVHGRFAPAAGMPIFLNLVMILGAWFALRGLSPGNDAALRTAVYIVSAFVIIAGLVQLLTQGWLMCKHESPTLVFTGARPFFQQFCSTFLPSFLALSVFQLNTLMDALIAMGLSPKDVLPGQPIGQLNLLGWFVDYPIQAGGLAALNNAQRLYQFPLGIFGVSVATAIFPALSAAAAQPGIEGSHQFRRILQQGLRLTVFIGLPASLGLILICLPLTRTLFERWGFTRDDAWRVSWVLIGYAPAIWAYAMSQVLTRAFYAVRDARTPMVLSIMMVCLNFVLNMLLVWPLGAAGLAWSTAIAAILQNVLLLSLIRGAVDKPLDREVWTSWGKTLALSLLMAAALIPILYFFPPLSLTKRQALYQVITMITLGAGVFLGGAFILQCPELHWLKRRRKKV